MGQRGREIQVLAAQVRMLKLNLGDSRDEESRLSRLIADAGAHWLKLLVTHPLRFEGGIDSAMEAACAEIVRLSAPAPAVTMLGILNAAHGGDRIEVPRGLSTQYPGPDA